MGVAGGPNIERDGLVFGYDTGLNPSSNFDHRVSKRRFFKGRNTTNIVTNTNLDTGWSKGYNTSIQTNDYPPPTGVTSQVYSFIDSDGNGSGYWYSYGDYAPQDPSTTYTISLWVRTVGSNFILRAYTANNSETGRQWTNYITIPGDGKWHRAVFNSITTPANTQSDSLSYQFTTFPANQRVWICAPQMEPSSVASPFIDGTRSSTESLQDLTKSTTIDVSNVSFGSDGLPTFDGTDDFIAITDLLASESIGAGTQLTISLWLNCDSYGIRMPFSTGQTGNDRIYYWTQDSKNTWRVGNYTSTTGHSTLPSVGTWFNTTLVIDGTNVTGYLNGEEDYTGSYTGFTTANYATFGRHGASSSYYFDGKIAVAKIYNKSLTPSEVQKNFKAYKNRFNI